MIGAVLFSVFKQFETQRSANPTISYTRLMDQAAAKQIDKVEIVRQGSTQVLNVRAKDGKDYSLVSPSDIYMVNDLVKAGVEVSVKI